MPPLTESDIERYAIRELEKLGYSHSYGPDIAPEGTRAERSSYDQVVLTQKLQRAISRINPNIPANAIANARKQVLRLTDPNPLTANKTFHNMLTEGIKVSYRKDGNPRGDIIKLIDFDAIDNNEFDVVNQFKNSNPNRVMYLKPSRIAKILYS
ncbi:MAG: type I restriction endonuclease [Flavobacteriales bacterium]